MNLILHSACLSLQTDKERSMTRNDRDQGSSSSTFLRFGSVQAGSMLTRLAENVLSVRSADSAIRWRCEMRAATREQFPVPFRRKFAGRQLQIRLLRSRKRSGPEADFRPTLRSILLSDCQIAPAAGYRDNVTGGLLAVGGNGYSWCSSSWGVGSFDGGRFRFTANDVQPVHYTNRSYALAVRCVQASATAAFPFPDNDRGPAGSVFRVRTDSLRL